MTKTQTLEELIEEFRKKFYGEMSIHDITGGYDPKPYLEAFIKKVYEAGGEAERKRVDRQEIVDIVCCWNGKTPEF